MNNNDKGRYRDDLERERLIYANGEYYKVRENWFSGGPYAVPRMFFDPYGPWRMARPVRHPLHYWEDLEFKYQGRLRDDLRLYYEHYIKDGEDGDLTMLAAAPLGAYVTTKVTPVIEIAFGDSNLNYFVEVEQDKVYRIDYMKDATLSTALGRIASCEVADGFDYRGKAIQYVVIKIDCSTDFGSDVRLIDSRDIRYIKSLEDLQTATSVTRTYVSAVEPEDTHGEFGGWYNPKTNQYFVKDVNGNWSPVPVKPEEEPEEGKYWHYNQENVVWEQKDIPARPDDYTPNTVWKFDQDEEKWIQEQTAPKPPMDLPDGEDITNEEMADLYIPAEPTTPPGMGKEWYYDANEEEWKKRDIMPDDGKTYHYDHTYHIWRETGAKPNNYAEDDPNYREGYDWFWDDTEKKWIYTEIVNGPDNFTIVNYLAINNIKNKYYVWYWNYDRSYHISPNVVTYDPETNTWDLAPDARKNSIPTEDPKDGYEWTYNSYYNSWGQTPITKVDPSSIPYGVNGHAFGREGVVIAYRPSFVIAVNGYTQFVQERKFIRDYTGATVNNYL